MPVRKFIIVIFVLVFPFWILHAQKVELSGINEHAGRFINEYFPGDNYQISKVVPHYLDNEAVIYYLQLDPEGWILLSAEKKAAPVIGFSYVGALDYRSVFSGSEPAGEWVRDISERILEYSSDLTLKPHPDWKNELESTKGVTVQALISAMWGQGKGWNYYCPEDTEGPDGKALVGCVAVAMAQALSVYESPISGDGENSYQHFVYGEISVNYSDSIYKWDFIEDTEPTRHSALLLYHCATSVNMNFGPDASSANTSSAVDALNDHFRISDNIKYSKRWEYGITPWENLMIEELEAGRPVIYRGRSDDGSSGHAFNVDGVVNSKYFHINWGWSGSSNGNFLLHELNPTDTRSYNANQEAIIGIEPIQSTAVSYSSAPEFSLYPNPAADILFLRLKDDSPIRSCTVFSQTGFPVLFKDNFKEQSLDISSLRPGYYILTISYTDNSRKSSQFIKSK
ncbi:MAG: C10 family peptidase [Bacteroidales bacterium]|nr:C10 family peptidase [Bacteroidales bacterium]